MKSRLLNRLPDSAVPFLLAPYDFHSDGVQIPAYGRL